jgi:Mg-chelatase subunit ChlD
VTVAALLVVLIGAVALVTDIGMIMAYRQQLEKATDAAVLAGAQDLPSTTTASATVSEYMTRNLSETDALSEPDITLTFSGNPPDAINAEASQQVSLWFARVLGLEHTTIRASSAARRMSADIMLILDRSGSMCEDYDGNQLNCPPTTSQPMNKVKDASVYFVNQLAKEGMIGVVTYNTWPRCDVRLKYLKNELSQVVAGIQSLAPGTGGNAYTDIGSGVDLALDSLVVGGRPNPKVIVLISDGKPNTVDGNHSYGYSTNFNHPPNKHVLDAAQHAKSKGAVIYMIAFGSNLNQTLMQEVVRITGGMYYRAPTTDDLYPIFHQIAKMGFVRLVPPA